MTKMNMLAVIVMAGLGVIVMGGCAAFGQGAKDASTALTLLDQSCVAAEADAAVDDIPGIMQFCNIDISLTPVVTTFLNGFQTTMAKRKAMLARASGVPTK